MLVGLSIRSEFRCRTLGLMGRNYLRCKDFGDVSPAVKSVLYCIKFFVFGKRGKEGVTTVCFERIPKICQQFLEYSCLM